MLLQQRPISKVGRVTTGGKNYYTINGMLLASEFVCDTRNIVSIFVDFCNACFLNDSYPFRITFDEFF